MWKNGRFVQPCKASRILSGITALHTIHVTRDVNERTLNINHWARVSKVSRVPSKLFQGIRIGSRIHENFTGYNIRTKDGAQRNSLQNGGT